MSIIIDEDGARFTHGGARPGAGRPAKPEQRRTARIELRATPATKELIASAAALDGMPVADWVRDVTTRAAKRRLKKKD